MVGFCRMSAFRALVAAAVAAALDRFRLWTIVPSEANEAFLDQAHFVPLPHIWGLSQKQIQSIR